MAMTDNEIHNWISVCNHEPAREVLREYLRMRKQKNTLVLPDGWSVWKASGMNLTPGCFVIENPDCISRQFFHPIPKEQLMYDFLDSLLRSVSDAG